MKKTYSLTALAILLLLQIFTTTIHAQNCWSPLGPGVGTNAQTNGARVMANYNGNLIVAGKFDTIGGAPIHNIAMWNGSTWSALGSGIKVPGYKTIDAMAVYNGALYVAGFFDTAGGVKVQSIAKWDGSIWSSVGPQANANRVSIRALVVHQGDLIAGGDFDSIGTVIASGIARFNGSTWVPLGMGVGIGPVSFHTSGEVQSMASINNRLYVGGNFTRAGTLPTVENIAICDDTTWSAMGTGLDTNGVGGVTTIVQYQGAIYAGVLSEDTSIAAVYYVAKWDGTSWTYIVGHPYPSPVKYGNLNVLFPYNGQLLAGGIMEFISTDTVNNIAAWNGSVWTGLDGGIFDFYNFSEVSSMDTLNGHLYVAGYFNHLGNTHALNIVEMTCVNNAIAELTSDQVTVYPNPTKGVVHLHLNNTGSSVEVVMYDMMGQLAARVAIDGADTDIDMSGKAAGIYLYRIAGRNGETIAAGKLTVE